MITTRRTRFVAAVLGATLVVAAPLLSFSPVAAQASYQRITGEGSSWSAGAIDAMRVNVKQFGITVDYNPSGSTAGRVNWLNGTVDFAASDIPFQFNPEDGSPPENPDPGSYAYIPVTAGGTSFIYNLKINGQRVTNLRLSGENITKIFTRAITQWNDPAIQADNPALAMPDRPIVPVVRSEGSGSTAQFTNWMIRRHSSLWNDYCQRSGRAPACGKTSFYPAVDGMISQSGDVGVTGYVTQGFAEGAIGYVNYSYAIGAQFPVVKVLNNAGFYTEPTPSNVAVSLLRARINSDAGSPEYLTSILDDVYTDGDPRNYELSAYSYFILRTQERGQFNAGKGRTLAAFAYYAMCQAQQQSASLGYSPLPINLVTASFDQIRKIPGAEVQNINVAQCNNPTFSPDGRNILVDTAPFPPECDRQGPTQCTFGTGGTGGAETPVSGSGGGEAGGGGGGTEFAAGGDGSTAAAGTDAAAATDVVIDPETGQPVSASRRGSSSSANELAGASTTVVAGSSGWSTTQTLMLIVGLLVLAAVFVPALVWRNMSNPPTSSASPGPSDGGASS
jgi:phosphate transport system substrate-binding protein